MTTIEQLVEALKARAPSSFSGAIEIARWHKLRNDAIAAGEAELRREPDATMLSTHQSTWFVQGDEQSEWPDEVQVTKLYTRGETK